MHILIWLYDMLISLDPLFDFTINAYKYVCTVSYLLNSTKALLVVGWEQAKDHTLALVRKREPKIPHILLRDQRGVIQRKLWVLFSKSRTTPEQRWYILNVRYNVWLTCSVFQSLKTQSAGISTMTSSNMGKFERLDQLFDIWRKFLFTGMCVYEYWYLWEIPEKEYLLRDEQRLSLGELVDGR